MKSFLIKWAILAAALVIASAICSSLGLPFKADISSVSSVVTLFIGVAALSLLNATLGNLLKLLTIPLNCLTLGLVSLVINAVMLEIVGNLHLGFEIGSFWAALVGSIFLSLAQAALLTTFEPKKK